VLARPQHPYTQQLVDSIAKRHVPDRKSDAPLLIDAQKIQVTYPVPIAGWRGWFRKGQFVAVQCATFQIKKAHTLGVMGESGSGKSTLALAVLGLLQFEGQLQIKEKSWMHQTQTDLPLRRAVQVVFQDPFSSLSPRMTVEQLVGEGLRLHFPDLSLSQRQDSVLQALSEVGLDETQFPGLLARYPHEFSGGQRQRLAIARALVVSPEILVLDEPTSALDVTIQRQVIDLLQQLQFSKGLSYLLITHDVDVIRAMSHDVCVMKDGQVVESGDVDAVLGNPQQAYTRLLVSASSHNLA
jgi:microcin C transport system ATP-binding protein